MQNIQYEQCFKALGDETRIKIIDLLENGSMCACKILENLNISQSTLSYHMKLLVGSGVVNVQKEGIWNYYSLNVEVLNQLISYLSKGCKNINKIECCRKK